MQYQKIVFLLITISIGTIFIATQFQNQENFAIQVNNSGPHIGTNVPYSYGYDGSGIIISVIDTGVDFNHPDLFGFDMNEKIIGENKAKIKKDNSLIFIGSSMGSWIALNLFSSFKK